MVYRNLFIRVMHDSRRLDGEYGYLVEYNDITGIISCNAYLIMNSWNAVESGLLYNNQVINNFWRKYRVATSSARGFLKIGFTKEFDLWFRLDIIGDDLFCYIWICSNDVYLKNTRRGFFLNRASHSDYKFACILEVGYADFGYFVLKDDNLLRFILNNACENLGNEIVRC